VRASLQVPPESERVGLMPTGFSRVKGITNSVGGVGEELAPAPPLPERFARIRARHDYLRWGDQGNNSYLSTSRAELCKPSKQVPIGGFSTEYDGAVVVPSDSSGYHMQVTQAPITPDPGM